VARKDGEELKREKRLNENQPRFLEEVYERGGRAKEKFYAKQLARND